MQTLEEFKNRYPVEQTHFSVGSHRLKLFVPQSIDALINSDDLFTDFPLWAKIWEATAVLTSHLNSLPVSSGRRMLEIGAGMGVAGLSAALMGHPVTITEYNEDALNFARANARLNGIDPDRIIKLDWHHPALTGRFDWIIGSEVVFKETDFPALMGLFNRYLAPGGRILLAEGMRKTSLKFLKEIEDHYRIRLKKQTLTTEQRKVTVVLMEMRQHGL